MRSLRHSTLVAALAAVLILLLAACGDDSSTTDAGDTGDTAAAQDTGDTTATDTGDTSDAQDMAEGMVDDLTDLQDAQGGGSATLTVGDQEWTFSSVLCAIGEEQTRQEGAEFNLSSIQDGLQLYASIDSFGESISLDDVVDFENPSVSLGTFGGGDATITLDGKNVSGEGNFIDGTTDSLDTIPGTLTATCP